MGRRGVSLRSRARVVRGHRAAPSDRPTGRATAPSRTRRASPTGKPASPTGRRSGPATPTARTATRLPADGIRRNRVRLAAAGAVALVVLATSFPLTVLLGQHRQLSAAAAQLSQLRRQNSALTEQHRQLDSTAEVKRLAQQNYQLVQPGRSLFVILPPAGRMSAVPGSHSAGDPANQPLVSPAQAPNMSPDPGLPATPVAGPTAGGGATTAGATRAPAGFWSRVLGSLQFWK